MQHLLLLHGAIGAKDQLQSLAEKLNDNYIVHTFNFTGHGGGPIPEEDFSIQLFATQVLAYLKENNIDKANIFGYSMGGYVAMYLAKNNPEKINKCITLATKYYWDEVVSEKEIRKLDGAIIQQKIPAFAEQLKQRHAPQDWGMVLKKTAVLLENLGKNNVLQLPDYAAIDIPVLLLIGDRDKMITLEETLSVFNQLPNAEMAMLPGTPHPIEQVDNSFLTFLINKFLPKIS
jgi:pimeloyl-ACP methyl ester carboxylesterase